LAVGTGAALSAIPVYADALTIPKLSYNPSIDQLITDHSLEQQMLKLDGSMNTGDPVIAEFGLGVDDNYTNIIWDYTTLATQQPVKVDSVIVVDKTHDAGTKPDKNTFYTGYSGFFSSSAAPSKIGAEIVQGLDDGTFSQPVKQLPEGFNWDISFTKTYFEPNKNHVVTAAQIPNSYMGPGDSNGSYGISLGLLRNNAPGPGIPANGSLGNPSSYLTVRTAIPIYQFPKWLVAPTAFASIFATLIAARKNRIEKKEEKST
jgi:hypothetical protein